MKQYSIRPNRLVIATVVAVAIALASISTFAQVLGALPSAAQTVPAPLNPAPLAVAEMPISPVIDPTVELKGAKLLDALRTGGLVLFMRHAHNGPPDATCGQESSLTPLGLSQAKTVGRAMLRLGIKAGEVWSSNTCRARQTAAALNLGAVQISSDLNPAGQDAGVDLEQARLKRLGTMPANGTNTVLVSHFHGAKEPVRRLFLNYAEIVVFRPKADGASVPVARLPVSQWESLMALPVQ